MLTARDTLFSDLRDAVARDPEVRQARMIAEAARTRLAACVSSQEDGIDLAEAQGMLDALRNAGVLAADAEDRVLLHHGLLTAAEADRRAVKRRPAAARDATAAGPPAGPPAGVPARVPARRPPARPWLFVPRFLVSRLSAPRPGGHVVPPRLVAAVLAFALASVLAVTFAQRLAVRQR